MTDPIKTRKPLSRLLPIVLTVLVVLAGSVWLALPRLRPYQFNGTVIPSPRPAPDFALTSAEGSVSLSDYRDKLVLLFFGYMSCPDVCPTTLAEVNRALSELGGEADDVQVIMVSVDPGRDTPDALAEYVEFFNPTFVGVTGTGEEVAEVASDYGIWYQANEQGGASGYLVDHTATLSVIDEEGRLKMLIGYGTKAEAIAADLEHLLR
jgi:protein SCO1/2